MFKKKESPQLSRFSFPIRIHLFVAIIGFVVLLGSVLGTHHYNKISELIMTDAKQMFDQVTENVVVSFRNTYKPVNSAVSLLSYTTLSSQHDYQERIAFLPMLDDALDNIPEMAALEVGYSNKEYFIVRKLNTPHLRSQFASPDDAKYVVDNIETDSGVGQMTRYYFNAELKQIETRHIGQTDYDPTVRPWFKEAEQSENVVTGRPYLFHFIGEVGVTIGRYDKKTASVVAADVTLSQVSSTLSKNEFTESSRLYLVNAENQVLPSTGADSVLVDEATQRIDMTSVEEIDDPVLQHFWQLFKTAESRSPDNIIELMDSQWMAAASAINLVGKSGFTLVMLVPKSELLSEALVLRNQSLMITLLIILFSVPAALLIATRISSPLKELARQTSKVRRFDFNQPVSIRSAIYEIGQLGYSMQLMQDTIQNFVDMIQSVAGETDFELLLENIAHDTLEVCSAHGVVVYLMSDDETQLIPSCCMDTKGLVVDHPFSSIETKTNPHVIEILASEEPTRFLFKRGDETDILQRNRALDFVGLEAAHMIAFPLQNRQSETVGVLCTLFAVDTTSGNKDGLSEEKIDFVKTISRFSALTIESSQMAAAQKNLLDAFIKLIAGAIDEKSPYTGGHCQRVPELTEMLAKAACESEASPFKDFKLSKAQWEELSIASWLHDCGKVTTPEYVVDKSTKLETIYDRIHEVRMRFEVMKRERELEYWKAVAEGGSKDDLKKTLEADLVALDSDFAFVAECNVGGEFMAPAKIERLKQIASRRWLRTLDNRLGLSWEEEQRMERTSPVALPVEECALADREDHLIARSDANSNANENSRDFKLNVPEHKLNKGEVYNLGIEKGTLSEEERFIINNHIVQTIIMLDQLPFPKHMKSIPDIAGGHHEKMDGTGYPSCLTKDQMPMTARMMAIADIFEALTASDRPYKKAKTLSESIKIMSFMKADQHIDGELFDLFLTSGVYRQYAEAFLLPEQIDEVDISQYVSVT